MNKHWKKITSVMLTICMCLCFISTNTWATTEKKDEGKGTEATTENKDQGIQSGDMWYQVKDGVIDIRGYKDGATVQTTAYDEGYPTLLSYNTETTPTKDNLIKFADADFTWKDDKLSVTPAVTFNEKNHSVVVTYNVKNISTDVVKYNLAVIADVALAGDNKAPVTKTENGVNILGSDKKAAYHMSCRKLAGSADADTLWVGESPRHWENAFHNSTENEVSDKNTAMACSWKDKELKAGETATYSYEVGSGEGSEKADSADPTKPTESTEETDPTKPTESTQETDPTNPTDPTEHQHAYGDPTFTWDNNYTKCTAKFICNACNETVEKSCNIGIAKEEDAFFVATVDFDGHTYTDTPKVTISVKKDSKNLVYLECNVPLIYFDGIEMDGKEIDDDNYTLKEGSTILTFTSKYMSSLKAGSHTITLYYQINEKTLKVEKKIKISKKSSDSDSSSNKNNNTKNNTSNSSSKSQYNAKGYMTVQVVDRKGNPMKGYSFKVDSKSLATLNADGRASFSSVLDGSHYLYLKDSKGVTLASERIKVEYATRYRVSGSTVYIMEDKAFVLHVKYDGRNLNLVSVEAGSPKTGDSSNAALWAGLMLVSVFGALFVIKRRKYV